VAENVPIATFSHPYDTRFVPAYALYEMADKVGYRQLESWTDADFRPIVYAL
jgi:hypothetical protein